MGRTRAFLELLGFERFFGKYPRNPVSHLPKPAKIGRNGVSGVNKSVLFTISNPNFRIFP
jgi:hypothetical protein